MRVSEKDRERFATMFDELSPRVFAYARRHCDVTSAQDVVSDTFLVAWRRLDVIPTDPLPWLSWWWPGTPSRTAEGTKVDKTV